MFLPDINVWLALTFESHIHHIHAKFWLDSISNENICFSRMTQQGFLRLSTNPSAFGTEAVTMKAAWNIYDKILSDTRIIFVNEPEGVEQVWRYHASGQNYSPKVWNDAYLAAFAVCCGFKLVTFDKGFRKYKKIISIILSN